MPQQYYRIGELARRSGVRVPTIRYYGEIGLLPEAGRGEGGQRFYTSAHLRRLTFIRRCRELGFGQDDVRALLSHADQSDADCNVVDRLAHQHLDAVRAKIASLRSLEAALQAMISACQGGRVENCEVIEALSSDDSGA